MRRTDTDVANLAARQYQADEEIQSIKTNIAIRVEPKLTEMQETIGGVKEKMERLEERADDEEDRRNKMQTELDGVKDDMLDLV